MRSKQNTEANETATASFIPLDEQEAKLVHLLSEGMEPAHIAEELRATPDEVWRMLAQLVMRLNARSGDARH